MKEDIKRQLIEWADRYEQPEFVAADPVKFPRRILNSIGREPLCLTDEEQCLVETVAVITGWLSYGNRTQILRAAGFLTGLVTQNRFFFDKRWREFMAVNTSLYRFYKWSDFAELCERLSLIFTKHGTLENCVLAYIKPGMTHVQALIQAFKGIRGFPKDDTSACKRLCMTLRWLVRQDSPVDLGIWHLGVQEEDLIIPLDTHVHRTALKLGLTDRKQADFRTAIEITQALKEVFPKDPLKGDFALFGYGIEHPKRKTVSKSE